MIPHQLLPIRYREPQPPPAANSEPIHVVELPFSTLYDYCELGVSQVVVAEAAVRRESSAGVFDRGVPRGWLQTLDDESSCAVIRASNDLNLHFARSKKLGGLMDQWSQLLREPQPVDTLSASGAPSSSSSPTGTPPPPVTP